jgi:hydroxymethylbilane synthase
VREPGDIRSTSLTFASLTSPLARNQAQAVIDRLQQRAPRLACQLDLLTSPQPEGQRAKETFVAVSRAELAFLLAALTEGRTRLLVLEAVDMLAAGVPGAMVACVPDRAAPFDAFLNRAGRIMDEMDPGSRVGVLSHRVRAQLQALWPDLRFEILRGGVDNAMETHLRRSEIDGLVLPASVTEHLGIQGIVAEIFAPEFVLPGPGQGTLVVLAREGDDEARELLAPLHSEDSALELAAETAFHRRMLPDQDLPVGALARVGGDGIAILGATGAGRQRVSVSGAANEAEAVGDGLAQQLLSRSDTFTDLLEGDFPDGLPEEPDEDATLLGGGLAADEDEERFDGDLEDLEELRGFEDLAGLREDELPGEDDEPDTYDDER